MEHLLPALNVKNASKLTGGNAALRFGVVAHEAVLIIDTEKKVFFAGDLDNTVRLIERWHKWLFAKNVRAFFHRLLRDIEMGTGWRANDYQVELRLLKHLFKCCEGAIKSELARHLSATGLIGIARGRDFKLWHGQTSRDMDAVRNAAQANNTNAILSVQPLSISR